MPDKTSGAPVEAIRRVLEETQRMVGDDQLDKAKKEVADWLYASAANAPTPQEEHKAVGDRAAQAANPAPVQPVTPVAGTTRETGTTRESGRPSDLDTRKK